MVRIVSLIHNQMQKFNEYKYPMANIGSLFIFNKLHVVAPVIASTSNSYTTTLNELFVGIWSPFGSQNDLKSTWVIAKTFDFRLLLILLQSEATQTILPFAARSTHSLVCTQTTNESSNASERFNEYLYIFKVCQRSAQQRNATHKLIMYKYSGHTMVIDGEIIIFYYICICTKTITIS